MAQPRVPRYASTVTLIRPDPRGNIEVFMTRRPREMEFLGGFYVFPGGTVKKADASPPMLRRCRGLTPHAAQSILKAELSPQMSLAHWVAGIREVFEEVGILLGTTENGEPADMSDARRIRRLEKKRANLTQGMSSFADFLESEGFYCDAGKAVYFFHRVTPEIFPKRFDTRFFLARMPEAQTPLPDSQEVSEILWITPARALEIYSAGRLPLILPTFMVLDMLREFESWDSLIARFPLK